MRLFIQPSISSFSSYFAFMRWDGKSVRHVIDVKGTHSLRFGHDRFLYLLSVERIHCTSCTSQMVAPTSMYIKAEHPGGFTRSAPNYVGWWFLAFFIFPSITSSLGGGLIFFIGVETTNQMLVDNCSKIITWNKLIALELSGFCMLALLCLLSFTSKSASFQPRQCLLFASSRQLLEWRHVETIFTENLLGDLPLQFDHLELFLHEQTIGTWIPCSTIQGHTPSSFWTHNRQPTQAFPLGNWHPGAPWGFQNPLVLRPSNDDKALGCWDWL